MLITVKDKAIDTIVVAIILSQFGGVIIDGKS
jgi:hypothetical protein